MEAFAQYYQGVVPKGYQPNAVGKGPLQYIGTGPFKVKSFTPGRESVHVKNANYWISGQPYFDQVRIIDFPPDAAKVNALLSGQVERDGGRPVRAGARRPRSRSLRIHRLDGRVDAALHARRRRALQTTCASDARSACSSTARRSCSRGSPGFGRVGNGRLLADRSRVRRATSSRSASTTPSRRSRCSSRQGTTVSTSSSSRARRTPGMVEGATIFAQNAKAGGVNVTVGTSTAAPSTATST